MQKKEKNVVFLGAGESFDVSSYPDYEKFTEDNFILEAVNHRVSGYAVNKGDGTLSTTINIEKVYDPSNGK